MEYNKIIAVTGLPGLYELLSSKADGAIVRSLDDKSTRFVSTRIHNFSHLESIEIYTVRENVNLVDILNAMETSAEKLPNEQDAKALKSYFTKVYPDLDFERVYSSDLKKMVKWFSVLKNNNIEIKLTEEAAEEPDETSEEQPSVKAAAPAAAGKDSPKKPAKEAASEPARAPAQAPAKSPAKAPVKEVAKAPAKKAEPAAGKKAASATSAKAKPKKAAKEPAKTPAKKAAKKKS
jgi:hypothetical protein